MDSKCQTCFNFGCRWHTHFQPVEGWTATETKINERHGKELVDSFCVKDCPEYTERKEEVIFQITTQQVADECGLLQKTTQKALAEMPEYYNILEKIVKHYKAKGFEIIADRIDDKSKYFLIEKGELWNLKKDLLRLSKW